MGLVGHIEPRGLEVGSLARSLLPASKYVPGYL